jgi:hypothetical protein
MKQKCGSADRQSIHFKNKHPQISQLTPIFFILICASRVICG